MLTRPDLFLREDAESVWSGLDGSSVLISGASGLVGLNFLRALVTLKKSLNLNVRLIGISKSGSIPRGFFSAGEREQIEFLSGDLVDASILQSLPFADFVVHAATYGQPAKFLADSRSTLLLNSQALANLMDRCSRRFLFVSSSEVYSGLPVSRQVETEIGTTGPLHPRAPYIEAKRFGETLTLHGHKEGQVANVARLSLAYGPGTRKDDRRVLNELIVRGLLQKRVELRGGADQVRSYLFVEDAIYYMLQVLLNGRGEIYNVGGLQSLSLGELAKHIGDSLGVETLLKTNFAVAEGVGAPDAVRIDMNKTRDLAGHFDHSTLRVGLQSTIDWYRTLIKVDRP